MLIKIGFVLSENQLEVKSLDLNNMSQDSKIIDNVGLADEDLNLLFVDQNDNLEGLLKTLEQESKFYPIVDMQSAQLSKDDLSGLNADELNGLYQKHANRWILNNNVKTIEQLYPTISYLKDMWVKDRNSFFEELWFLLKTNLNTTDLTMIFNDLKEPTEKQKEKGDKPVLCHSFVAGTKIPQLFTGKEKEAVLMKEYEKEFSDLFNITEYSREKKQLVACAKIGLSPILIMGQLPIFNQLQQSILIALFTGLQEE